MLYRNLTSFPHHTILSVSATTAPKAPPPHSHLSQPRRVPTLVPSIRLQVGRRRFEVALENIIRNPNPQRHPTNWKQLTGPVTSGPRGHVSDILGILILGRAVGIDVSRHDDILGREGVETPMDAEEDTAERGVEHGLPDAVEVAGHERADVAELVRDGFGGDVIALEVAVDAVEFVGDEVKGNVIRGVVREIEVVTSLVVETKDLEAGAGEGGVAGGVGREGRFEVWFVAIGVRGTFCAPERVPCIGRIETDAG